MRGTLIRIFCKSKMIIQWSAMLNASRSETGCEVLSRVISDLPLWTQDHSGLPLSLLVQAGRQKMRRLVRLDHCPTRLVEDALRFKIFDKLPAQGFANLCDILQVAAQPARLAR